MKLFYVLISIFAIIGGVAILVSYYDDPSGNFPSYSELSEIEGEIDWVKKHRYGIRFGLKNDQRSFNYPSKARELGLVREALESAADDSLSVFVDFGNSSSPIYEDEVYFTVFEIRIAGNIVRDYKGVSEAWESDQRLMPYLGVFGVFGGLYILWMLRKKKIP